jgi:hypothetical protein
VVVGLSVWWKKLARDGKNANELTSSDVLTDMGRAPTFYDCLVQVEALSSTAAAQGNFTPTGTQEYSGA